MSLSFDTNFKAYSALDINDNNLLWDTYNASMWTQRFALVLSLSTQKLAPRNTLSDCSDLSD